MRTSNSSYLPSQSIYPFQGVDFLGPSTQIGDSFAAESQNIDTTLGHLTKRKGYSSLSTTARQPVTSITRSSSTATVTTALAHGYTTADSIPISGATQSDYNGTFVITVTGAKTFTYTVANAPASPATGTIYASNSLSGVVLAFIEFKDIGSVTRQVLVTTTREYSWNGATWDDITYRTVAPVYTARTGSEDNGIDWVVTTGKDSTGAIVTWLIITNGVDKPRYWDGSLAHFYEFSTSTVANKGAALVYSGFVTCKTISSMQSYLVLGNVTTSAAEPNVVVWSDTQSLVDFTNGNSGAELLTDAIFAIQKILPLGDALMVYSDDSIHSMIHIGADDIFSFQRIITNTRLLGGRAIVDLGPFHYFMSQENIYLFDGTRGLRRLADRITTRYRDIFLSDLKTRAWAFLDQPKNSIYFAVPTASGATTIFRAEFDIFDVTNLRWNIHVYASRATCMGFYTNTQTQRWQDVPATQTWAQTAGTWNQASVNKGFPRRVIGGNGVLVLADETLFDDTGTAVTASWESKDFTIPRDFLSEFGRWSEIEFEARGNSVAVSISTDKGFSYQTAKSVSLNGSWKRYRVFIDLVSQTLRVKFSNAQLTENLEIRWFRVWFTHSGSDD